ncbi:hypothetical protein RvY_06244 [Ramazzottius varieornatus]|uniref:Uncharacterized protein n=1 Tax=Ramazzottius varieornatus TaxID=947166 RepID=A0A1D1V6M4_RAMVA|nr:hypothetical protein RvY_06244 [Ramazzottius varieornatus]
MMMRVFFLVSFAVCMAVAHNSELYIEDDYCPIAVCSCDIVKGGQGAIMNCSGNEYITLESLMTMLALNLCDDKGKAFIENLRSITLEPKAIRVLPNVDLFLDYFFNMKLLFLGNASMDNCGDLDAYRERGIVVQSEVCPDEGPTGAPETITLLAPDYKDYQTETSFAQPLSAPDHGTSLSTPPTTVDPSKKSEAEMAWTVIFLNCCFVGLSGMILGALLALILPPLFTKIVTRIRRQNNRQMVADLEFQAKFRPLLQSHSDNQSSTSGSMPRSHLGSSKRTTV